MAYRPDLAALHFAVAGIYLIGLILFASRRRIHPIPGISLLHTFFHLRSGLQLISLPLSNIISENHFRK
jgi:hypothetical protein